MMKLLVGGAIAAVAIATAPVVAQTAPPPPPGVAQGTGSFASVASMRPVAPEARERSHMMIMSDRVMTREDVVRHVRDLFARFDTNRDGYVTRGELEAFHARFARMAAGMPKRLEDHAGIMGDRSAMFDRLDANHDGMISRQEFMAAQPNIGREQRVMIIRDGAGAGGMPRMDGMDGMHMRMHGMGMHEMGGGFGGHLFEMADANHDGRVSLQEAESLALRHFDRADLNHDGRITPDERRQAHELMRRDHRPG